MRFAAKRAHGISGPHANIFFASMYLSGKYLNPTERNEGIANV